MATASFLLDQAKNCDVLDDHLLRPLTRCLNDAVLLKLARGFSETFTNLAKKSHQHFLSTPVTALPTGHETGKFLAIDVGGTNLRVACIELLGDDGHDAGNCPTPASSGHGDNPKIRMHSERAWLIEEHMKKDRAEDLFAWIGDCIAGVLNDVLYGQDATIQPAEFGGEIPLGITFSFPMMQTSISEATLMPMGKGFAITSKLSLGKLLLAGYERHCTPAIPNSQSGLPPNGHVRRLLPKIHIAAITNDTVSTYTSLAYSVKISAQRRVAMGVVVGTGTNATIPMHLSDLGAFKIASLKLPLDIYPSSSTTKIVVNTEWSVCGTEQPTKPYSTPWDAELDRNTDAPGFQPIEYMTSGRYLGELVRLVLIDMLSKETTPTVPDSLPQALGRRNAISTRFLAGLAAQTPGDEIRASLETMFPTPPGSAFAWSKERTEALQAIAAAVLIRSTALIAAMVVGLLVSVGELHIENGSEDNEARAGPESSSANQTASLMTLTALPKSQGATQTEAAAAKAADTREELIVACTGGLILQYPGYLLTCQHWIDRLVSRGSPLNGSKRVVLGEARDGGIIGAAVLAAMFSGSR